MNIEPNDDTHDKPTDIALSEALKILTEALISKENTNLTNKELKAVSICFQNPYIKNLLQDYVPNKRYVKAKFNKSIQEAIDKVSKAIGMSSFMNSLLLKPKGFGLLDKLRG